MDDLDTGIQLIEVRLRDFEVSREKFVAWEKYNIMGSMSRRLVQ